MRLPTEAEYHRAAFGTPAGGERAVPVGRRTAGAPARQLRIPALRSRAGRRASRRRERAGASRDLDRQRLGVDRDAVRPASRLRADGVVSAVLGRLLRRQALRHEGCVAGDAARTHPPQSSETGSTTTIRTCTQSSAASPDATRLALLAAAGAFVVGVTACSQERQSERRLRATSCASRSRSTRRSSIRFSPQNTIENFVDGLIFNLLVTHDEHHHQIPDLAATVPTLQNGGISKDGLTITYQLRHGVKWHDGVPFTSKDVKFTWQAIMNPRNNVVSRRGYDQVASMDTPDDYTVVMHMKRIFPPAVDTHLRRERHDRYADSSRASAGEISEHQSGRRSMPRRSAPDLTSSCAGCAATASSLRANPSTFAARRASRS